MNKVQKVTDYVRKDKSVKGHYRKGDGAAHRALVAKLAKMTEPEVNDGRSNNHHEFKKWLSEKLGHGSY